MSDNQMYSISWKYKCGFSRACVFVKQGCRCAICQSTAVFATVWTHLLIPNFSPNRNLVFPPSLSISQSRALGLRGSPSK